jgi:uncharacterized protein (DUF2147 family)
MFKVPTRQLANFGIAGNGRARNLTSTALVLASLLVTGSQAQAQSLSGIWARGDGNARVRIAPCGANICATNTWIRKPSSEKVGQVLIMKVKKVAAGLWKGSAFDPQRNLTVSMQMKVRARSMITSGCIVGGLICKSTNWSRIK